MVRSSTVAQRMTGPVPLYVLLVTLSLGFQTLNLETLHFHSLDVAHPAKRCRVAQPWRLCYSVLPDLALLLLFALTLPRVVSPFLLFKGVLMNFVEVFLPGSF
jgi:hypothetical protein